MAYGFVYGGEGHWTFRWDFRAEGGFSLGKFVTKEGGLGSRVIARHRLREFVEMAEVGFFKEQRGYVHSKGDNG